MNSFHSHHNNTKTRLQKDCLVFFDVNPTSSPEEAGWIDGAIMHLKRKDSIKLKNIRKWMEGKIPVLRALAQILHPLPAYDKSDGMEKLPCAQTLHPPLACR